MWKKVIVQELFLDSNHVSGRATSKNIAEHIINILEKHVSNCLGQAYDGENAMGSFIKCASRHL